MNEIIKTIIIDDEKLARDIIKTYLEKYDNIQIVAECSNGFEALKEINELKPDIIFLDIQMPKISGFEMLELLEDPPIIIFTTAFDNYAIKAFEVSAVDYLLKPFSEERFDDALKKAMNLIKNKDNSIKKLESLARALDDKKEYLERIVVKQNQKITIIPVDEIKYIEAQDDYVMLYTSKGNYLKEKTMKYYEENLDPKNFIRIHRSYIVKISNIKQIDLLEKDSYKIILTDGTHLPVSKSGYQKITKLFN
ncbi:MAG: LytTR family transcriptional regulator DNA-binding domain-containing protein [Melioribacter sp.]|uniref:LytR/AlgR family response regulator transcription factor n=1 Tax=Rosettibacter primus TaxID=3111523 RepID=UPI00247C8B9B|nr:LytTR family transcriptional regulator DNA-binding domain-containing protein [Melioribacter sp.]